MKVPVLALTTLSVALASFTNGANAQIIFGQSTSPQATPAEAFFLPANSVGGFSGNAFTAGGFSGNVFAAGGFGFGLNGFGSSFFPPQGFYHYLFLPQYAAAYNEIYSDFQYDLPKGKVTYDFTVIKSFEYEGK
ncbi:hypothetical protein C1752_04105 [Acaryochloris thomasi RCC1774]|uniref:Uncharacterized protein n=1 Tax=Acaryochloris thomasi RCC1774 TaxID=1764569 RepID=A0A2W1JL11_9CYAN|nr:hypothetical protein [Acaryochloris thomasi]PZD72135.1 hypothetical protein C1752_04105 [Acaryochloris thomasi RCC1774]